MCHMSICLSASDISSVNQLQQISHVFFGTLLLILSINGIFFVEDISAGCKVFIQQFIKKVFDFNYLDYQT